VRQVSARLRWVSPREEPDYYEESRDLSFGLLAVIPLLVMYEFGLIFYGTGSETNLVGDILKAPLQKVVGVSNAVWVLNGILLVTFSLLARKMIDTGRMRITLFLGVWVEGVLYAMVLGQLSVFLVQWVALSTTPGFLQHPIARGLFLSIGAGVYEELVFRLALLGAFAYLFEEWYEFETAHSATLSIVLASALFSLIHVVGEPFERDVFFFRMAAGILLSVLYLLRGFAVAVYTHVCYDVLVFLQKP
jgi:hypothetical protein